MSVAAAIMLNRLAVRMMYATNLSLAMALPYPHGAAATNSLRFSFGRIRILIAPRQC